MRTDSFLILNENQSKALFVLCSVRRSKYQLSVLLCVISRSFFCAQLLLLFLVLFAQHSSAILRVEINEISRVQHTIQKLRCWVGVYPTWRWWLPQQTNRSVDSCSTSNTMSPSTSHNLHIQ